MSRIEPVSREAVPELHESLQMTERSMGFTPNSLLIMAHRPEILRAFSQLTTSVLRDGVVDSSLKRLVALVASTAHGCRYCQAHTAESGHRLGISTEKLQSAFDFETSPLFSEAERAALRLARDASIIPNAVTDDHFAALKKHFSDPEIVELVSVISLYGWFNRWNDTLATELEANPLSYALSNLTSTGWEPGKHLPAAQPQRP